MREIKFRAWIRCGEWDTDGEKQAFEMIDAESLAFEMFEPLVWQLADIPDQRYLMQYVGVKDKNGKEIYEGDILLIQDTWKERILDDGSGPTEPCNHLSAVGFFNGMFGVFIRETADIYNTDFWSFERLLNEDDGDLEVIGNIYENPELLK